MNGGRRRENIPHAAGVTSDSPPAAARPSSWSSQRGQRGGAALRVEVADEGAHLRADRRHGHAGGARGGERLRPGRAGVAQLQPVEAGLSRERAAGDEVVARHEVLLHHEPHTTSLAARNASTRAGESACSVAIVAAPTIPARGPRRLVVICSSRVASGSERW